MPPSCIQPWSVVIMERRLQSSGPSGISRAAQLETWPRG